MKKLSVLLAGLALVAFTFTSCKKEWDCTCTFSGDGVTLAPVTTTSTKMSKGDAEEWCNTGDYDLLGVKSECELD